MKREYMTKATVLLAGIGFAVFGLAGPGTAAINVNGMLDANEWGLTFSGGSLNFGASPISNNPTHPGTRDSIVVDGLTIDYHVEDTSDSAWDNFYLGPNYGGQNYDAEFMATAVDGNFFHMLIVSGQRPDNGFKRFGPGDIRIVTDAATLGIEVGGGTGTTTGARPKIEEGADGSTYTLWNSGYTKAHTPGSVQTAGSLWLEPDWIYDPISPPGPTQFQFSGGQSKVGDADYVFTRNDGPGQHSVIELALDMSLLGPAGTVLESVHWRPSCGNDELNISWEGGSGPKVVPEPATLLVWAGLIAMASGAWCWRRRTSRA